MGDGTRFAIGLVIMWLAFLFFYFAFHPNGVPGVNNPAGALKWLIGEFQKLGSGNAPSSADQITPTPSGQPSQAQEFTEVP
jgi:hypothetical protein